MNSITASSTVLLVHRLYEALGIIQNSLVLLAVGCNMESIGSKLLVRDKLLVSALVVLAQPPSGKDMERLSELVPRIASIHHERNK